MQKRLLVLGLLLGLCLTSSACKGGSGATDTPLNPNNPPPGLDTSQAQMRDGAGNTGPARARLLSVRPDLNSQVVVDTSMGMCNKNSPYNCFELDAEICMDTVSNPNNNPLLNSMRIGAVFSTDGVTPILKDGHPIDVSPLDANKVTPGSCTTMLTDVHAKPPYPAGGAPKYLMLYAVYGIGPQSGADSPGACPTPDSIANSASTLPPTCALRRVYELGYHF